VRAFVAGGAGFIGSHLVDRLLAEGHDVDVADDLSTGSLANLADARSQRTGRLKIHQVDVRDSSIADLVVQRHPEVLYLLIDGVDEDPVDVAQRTLLGGIRILDGARRAGADKVVVATSTHMYGRPAASSLPVREADAAPHDASAAASLGLLGYLEAYRAAHGIEFTLLAMSSVYGPRQRRGLVADLVGSCWAAAPCTVDDPDRTVDLVFVDDTVDALVRASERGSGLIVNVGTGIETPLAHLHELVSRAVETAGGPARVGLVADRGATEGAPRRLAIDPRRARIQLGWTSWTTVADGVDQTVDAGT
jgi:UDP-glucose 4-epimerase